MLTTQCETVTTDYLLSLETQTEKADEVLVKMRKLKYFLKLLSQSASQKDTVDFEQSGIQSNCLEIAVELAESLEKTIETQADEHFQSTKTSFSSFNLSGVSLSNLSH